MCGRIHQKDGTLPWLQTEMGDSTPEWLTDWIENFNGAPTQWLWVIRRHPTTGGNVRDRLRWGFIPSYYKTINDGPTPINAKCETIATNGMFRNSYKSKRCLIPIHEYFEWKQLYDDNGKEMKPKQPWAIGMKDKQPFALAGIWNAWKDPVTGEVTRSFAIVTCDANEIMQPIHHRMPVIITAPEAAERWLANIEPDPNDLMRPYPSHLMTAWRISTKVNSPRYNAPDIMDPV